MADNKNIEADYNLVSDVPDGFITLRSVMKNGNLKKITKHLNMLLQLHLLDCGTLIFLVNSIIILTIKWI
ncbi:hypothetical protein P700755_001793 [Psychroflexus torquis ATCC 700755]|uniref:Uncharacterized protein n=1 Tax=Psychroflexus torquis (strain ATCC 700755 / CIP 106069 / ACAM 623) TaxID=313595 RepID=K4IFP2_PSYTT|nr:hypothetical protein P700755_001793 [Psychroflexus torquis ATCC 700755]